MAAASSALMIKTRGSKDGLGWLRLRLDKDSAGHAALARSRPQYPAVRRVPWQRHLLPLARAQPGAARGSEGQQRDEAFCSRPRPWDPAGSVPVMSIRVNNATNWHSTLTAERNTPSSQLKPTPRPNSNHSGDFAPWPASAGLPGAVAL